jgi:hypothetical protein
LRSHAWALVFVLTASAIGQLAVLIQRPLAVLVVDSADYLAVAHRILATGQFTDPLRTPGYPAFLGLVFLLTGKDNFTAVVAAQTMLMLTGTLGIYLLAHRVGLARWAAASVAALVGIDPYLVNFERDVFTETLAFWLAVMLFLVFERYLRHGRRVALVGLVGLSVASILTRPVFIFIPLVLAAVMLRCAVSRARPRDAWRVPALVAGATYGLLVIYAGASAGGRRNVWPAGYLCGYQRTDDRFLWFERHHRLQLIWEVGRVPHV